jgi:hypothetical protein
MYVSICVHTHVALSIYVPVSATVRLPVLVVPQKETVINRQPCALNLGKQTHKALVLKI